MIDLRTLNATIKAYFKANEDQDIIPAKKLMPSLIEKGVFIKDEKNGLPVRNALKAMEKAGKLEKIRDLHVVRKGKHNFWYFMREGHTPPPLEVDNIPEKESTKRKLKKRGDSDEQYVIDLCDEVLGLTGLRHHTFEFLRGDLHRNGRTRSKLPCDAYYSKHKLVVEYTALVQDDKVYDSPAMLTATGKTRAEQRQLYQDRKREALPRHKYNLIEIPHASFELNELNLIVRNKKKDLKVVSDFLVGFREV